MNVRPFDTSLIRFFFASIALHSLVFSLLYLNGKISMPARVEAIAVSLLPAPSPEKNLVAGTRLPPASASRLSRTPTVVAKKDSPAMPNKPPLFLEKALGSETARDEPRAPDPPATREPLPENAIVAERPLPSLRDLLPPPSWSSSSARSSTPVSLNTRDPAYVTYFNKIKQMIESQWEYPEMALRYGLQGKLALEFTVSGNGRLEQIRLIRSSGSQLLDDEAVRAIRAAAPFPPIPPWIKSNPLSISASMEYHDSRLNYRFSR